MVLLVGVGGPVIYSVLFLNPRNADRRWTADESIFSFFHIPSHMLCLILPPLLNIIHSALTIGVPPHYSLSQSSFSSFDQYTASVPLNKYFGQFKLLLLWGLLSQRYFNRGSGPSFVGCSCDYSFYFLVLILIMISLNKLV